MVTSKAGSWTASSSGVRSYGPKPKRKAAAERTQTAEAPRFNQKQACEQEYGVGNCETRQAAGGSYSQHKYMAVFGGVVPATNPRLAAIVVIDEPSRGRYYGGDVAAPVFSEVVQQTLRMMGVQPDLDVKPQIVSRDVRAERESF